jgi:hypothetical protein
MTTIFDMTTEFEDKMQEELSYRNEQLEGLFQDIDYYNEHYDNLDSEQLWRMDEIPNVDIPEVQSKIDKIIAILEAIKNEKKKRFEKLKFAIEEKSLQMLYNPKRVARLLDAGLISFEEEGSLDNL